jgi:acetylornithine/succinyldiaminopimelate/putrescine aminotransferase
MAITFAKAKSYGKEENEAKLKLARKWIESHPNIVFSSDGEGLAKDVVFVSFHENYSKYAGFVREFSASLADFFNDVQSFVVSLKTGVILKPFDLATLANDISQLQIEEDHP